MSFLSCQLNTSFWLLYIYVHISSLLHCVHILFLVWPFSIRREGRLRVGGAPALAGWGSRAEWAGRSAWWQRACRVCPRWAVCLLCRAGWRHTQPLRLPTILSDGLVAKVVSEMRFFKIYFYLLFMHVSIKEISPLVNLNWPEGLNWPPGLACPGRSRPSRLPPPVCTIWWGRSPSRWSCRLNR